MMKKPLCVTSVVVKYQRLKRRTAQKVLSGKPALFATTATLRSKSNARKRYRVMTYKCPKCGGECTMQVQAVIRALGGDGL